MPDDDFISSHDIRELEQEKKLLEKINKDLENKSKITQYEKNQLKKELDTFRHDTKELEMAKKFLEKIIIDEKEKSKKLTKKNILIIAGAIIAIGIISMMYSLMIVDIVGREYRVQDLGEIKSNYVIQNLRGDTIDTWLSWRLVDGTILVVNIIDGEKYPDKVDLANQIILSEKSIEIDNSLLHKGLKGTSSLYYVGWSGALTKASENPSELYIPNKFEVIESSRGEGDITIHLTNTRNGDGNSGFTNSIADDSQNQILKSSITIYEVDKLSNAQFETILRHEFGHALGLAHSTAPEDLMYPIMETEYPYISDCDIDAIVLLYDNGKSSQVVCEK